MESWDQFRIECSCGKRILPDEQKDHDHPRAAVELIPGRNTGTKEKPCSDCLTETRWHATFCVYYLYQRQYEEASREARRKEESE